MQASDMPVPGILMFCCLASLPCVRAVQEKEKESPDFNLLGLNCTGDASESGLIKCVELLRSVEGYNQANPKLHEIKVGRMLRGALPGLTWMDPAAPGGQPACLFKAWMLWPHLLSFVFRCPPVVLCPMQFNSTNKWQLSIHRPEDPAAQHPILVLKGAPERVLRMCTHIMHDGESVPMDEGWQAKYNEAYEALGAMGERVLGFAYREMREVPLDYEFTNKPEPNFEYKNLTFVGLMSLIDPPREGVKEAVEKCKRARIKVYMVTGDHPITAQVGPAHAFGARGLWAAWAWTLNKHRPLMSLITLNPRPLLVLTPAPLLAPLTCMQAIAKQIGIIDEEMYAQGKAIVVKGDDIRDWMEIEDPVARQVHSSRLGGQRGACTAHACVLVSG
jgi:hypothetical protein